MAWHRKCMRGQNVDKKIEIIEQAVDCIIKRLTKQDTGDRYGKLTAWSTAMLARLRHAADSKPGRDMGIWEITIGILPVEEYASYELEKAELAVHTTLTLFGIHQQGKTRSVSRSGVGFGKAVRKIVLPDRTNEAGVWRVFTAMVSASDFYGMAHYARNMVRLMRSSKTEDIKFDYPKFATDLYLCQMSAEMHSSIMRKWGRDYYAANKTNEENDNKFYFEEEYFDE
jgi:CRISPR type I-E-associated protein CasB/Cse2